MAIQFNANALRAFSNFDFHNDNAIANLNGENGIKQNGKLGSKVWRVFRSGTTKANNNAVRTELLKALGRAFNLEGAYEHGGKTTFTEAFRNNLQTILGDSFKLADFGFDADGAVASGKPLTQRRIKAVCNAAKQYAADSRFQDVSVLLKGAKFADIFAENRGNGWNDKMNNMAVLAAKVRDAALSLKNENDTIDIKQGDVEINLMLLRGKLRAVGKVGDGPMQTVEDFEPTKEELCFALDDAISALYDSFPEVENGNLTYGHAAIFEVVDYYENSTSPEERDTKNSCSLRDFAGGILMTKAGITGEQISKLTNTQLATFVRTLCLSGNVQEVKDKVAQAVALDAKFEDVSSLLKGKTIGEVIGDKRDEGWEAKVNDFAGLAVKIHRAAQDMNAEGDSAQVEHGEVKIEFERTAGGINASLRLGGATRNLGKVAETREELCFAMDDTVSSLYGSFTEKKDRDLTYGRAALANTVWSFYNELPEDDKDTRKDCAFRNLAGGILMTKAGVPDGQIAKLTNRELANFLDTLCNTGDGPSVKETISLAVDENKEMDEEIVYEGNEEEDLGNEGEVEDERQPEPLAKDGKAYEDINAF